MTAYRAMTPEQKQQGLQLEDYQLIGRDPRNMTQDELIALGHQPTPTLKAIRERCLDCCAEQPNEVRKCTSVGCPSWPFRMGTNPWRDKQTLSDEQRKTMAERLKTARLHQKASPREPATKP